MVKKKYDFNMNDLDIQHGQQPARGGRVEVNGSNSIPMKDINSSTNGTVNGHNMSVAVISNDSANHNHYLYKQHSQISKVQRRNAVEVRNLDLTYGFGIKTNVVLTGMSLTVPMGGIYALIGPSGCGKTSILRCMMGFTTPDNGTIKVFGKKPGEGSVPGVDLGYMPQDVALNEQLTVYEMLRYFARIFLLSSAELEKRIDRLIQILDIPDKERFIHTLSGGQRRRVSFACAVIHKPKLAILDEPTVGVDPLVREKMWEYLLEMTKEGCTILLTTHYIEETRRADVIGFLRKGYLLAEEPPEKILTELKVDKLEDAFYQLCIHEEERRKKYHGYTDEEEEKQFHNYPTIIAAILWLTQGLQQFRRHKKLDGDWFYTLWAIVEKFYIQIWREKLVLFVWLFIPVIALVATLSCLGDIPTIYFGVINEDNDVVTDAFLDNLDPKIWNVRNFTDPIEAAAAVDRKELWGYVHFYSNFSDTILKFPNIWENIDNISLTNFNIVTFKVDFSNQITLAFAALSVYQAMPLIFEDFLKEAGMNPRLLEFPIGYGEPVYGRPLFSHKIDLFDVKNLIIPGCLLYAAFATSMIIALYFMRLEKLNNMFERTYSAGVSATQIIVAQFIVRTFFNFFSVTLTLWVAMYWYGVRTEGSILWVMVLMLLQNLSGLAYGLAFTAISVDPIHFVAFAGGSVGSFLFFSGIMWPIEAQPYFFQWVAKFTPLAIPSESLRSIMVRGLPITDPLVYPGFLISIGYFLLFLVGAANFFNLKAL